MKDAPPRLGLRGKLRLGARVWARYAVVAVRLKREPLPGLVRRLGAVAPTSPQRIEPRRLGRVVQRVLRVGPWQPRCLFTALVLFRLLREQGDRPELVIGLPTRPKGKDAHAWVELEGVDVGPPPGRGQHEALARYA